MIKWNGCLPLGSIVLLNGSDKRMQIIGQLQADARTHDLYDYVAVPFPEGYVDDETLAMFQHEDIRLICAVGHLDDGTWDFLKARQQLREDLHTGRVTVEELLARRQPVKTEKEAEEAPADGGERSDQ